MITDYEKEKINEVIEKLFFNQIDVEFLKEMLWRTYSKCPIVYNFQDFYKINPIVTSPIPNIYIMICKHIIGIHKSNIWDLSREEVNKLQNDEAYKNKIIDKTWTLISIRDVRNEMFFLNEPLIQGYKYSNGSPILYYPYLFCIATICFHVMNSTLQDEDKNVFHKTLAFLLLLNNGFIDEAFAQLRTILEECFQEIIFMFYPEVRAMKKEFNTYSKEDNSLEKNDEFVKKYEKAKVNEPRLQWNQFLDYGWLDAIPDYDELIRKFYGNKNHPFMYSIKGMQTYLLLKLDIEYQSCKNEKNFWLLILMKGVKKNDFIKLCSDFVHAKYVIPDLLSKCDNPTDFKLLYYWILECLYLVKIIYEHISGSIINGVNVMEILQEELEKGIKKCCANSNVKTEK